MYVQPHFRYITDFEEPISAKDKFPWITLNGKNVDDSQLAIEYIKKELKIDANSHLSPRERGFASGMRLMLEKHLFFVLGVEAFVHQSGKHVSTHYPPGILFPFPKVIVDILVATVMKWKLNNMLIAQGVAKHER